ncbi:MAG: ribonuclease H-like domain-containing protein [Mogibacterium sp.]|nr:ribonuclease H-like domain-containing protein [Mogibacterium sp.]
MKVFTRDYRITGEYHPLWGDYFDGMEPCVLDIEATGLDRVNCKAVLIGLLTRTDSGVRITQFLAENHYEEAKVLDTAMDFIEEYGAGFLVTFNGYAYDIPFINARLEANMLGRKLNMFHFDLYRFLCKSTDMRKRIGSMSQKSIEDHYGILSDRGDTISGRESVTLFDQYALSGNSTIEKIILTHNREDVLHLHRLMYLALADVPDLHQALAVYGLPAAGGRLSVRHSIKRARQGKTADPVLRITGEQIVDPISCAYFPDGDSPVTAVFNSESRSFEISVPVSSHPDALFLDMSFLRGGINEKDPALAESLNKLLSDPDCVNGYLILSPRASNMIARYLAEMYYSM